MRSAASSRPAPSQSVSEAARRLAEAGCDTPWLDAELLLREGADLNRRIAREPVAYILGRKAFRWIELSVDRRVLIPRPDTETLVEVALSLASQGARVHDVGTGSGAIALAMKAERPDLVVTASDASPEAVEVALENAARLGLDVPVTVARGWPAGEYDLVVANLPYVREDEWEDLAPEIRLYEPSEALVSGPDGLDAIRELAAGVPAGTLLALEHAPSQAAAVRGLLGEGARTERDLAGRERVTVGRAP
ncbi:MAG TPA: peptide chain release factor N(5)-glutamine methyltransferase [Thermoleophilaceae bacterium]|jgi:release factor glutamine methyltransferase